MQIFRDKPSNFGPSIVTIGTFDGVHTGHKRIIEKVVTLAHQHEVASVVLTFDPLPRQVHHPDPKNKLICSLPDRLTRIEQLGVDATWVQQYDLDFAAQSPAEFVHNYLVAPLRPEVVVIGEDMRFGAQNSGDAQTLRELGEEFGFTVETVSNIVDPIFGRRWSSSWVRELLAQGRVDQAAYVLGHAHSVRGTVVHGKRRGRELGFPTANLDADFIEAIPADGVYAGWLRMPYPPHSKTPSSLEVVPAAISVGTSPHFGDVGRTVEAHVLGRADLDLYGEEVVIEFVHRIRDNLAFDSLDALLERMDRDLWETAVVLGVPKAQRIDPAAVTA
ncbi:bifunctional riboflavin kinase/FAD synthetase [Mobiluncus curtisii]|uniref:Riboflavin biosynthesis protein n=1 Tax=Mobiluncus curtisii TaxID=2051 RepID=A0A7Y0UH30_9ACTO|nr:bifunctional riboflavin kinase/FAD synthetase [Mobiluncus curtisii]EFL92941.1 riboflavin biosynthesis protein RibF [Mobiluncus curtisii subsp. curtisii ATCC 35241]MCU9987046.1 bifunctional riboflavin kinase/FAD synthetase [Mobiluncus curtisii]MCU9999946.1 bifunctional riboflavin kinase/FAD synthetase [Mobiluncus curtisii]NMW49072.1 bifunctional riboflavin kinase/FAD synthetase [Mobiluncus curtisii]NMW86781.1 bifunctional riboflavin kinase/FAD synthetase [Mobiluncus curtisii]